MLIERNEQTPLAAIEDAGVELMQALALIRAIDEGELFSCSPNETAARKRHEAGVTLLAMIEPRLERALMRLKLSD